MGLIQALASAPRLRQFAGGPALDLPEDFRAIEPELDMPWPDEPEAAERHAERPYAANEVFLVCEQQSLTPRGEPVFSKAFASSDDNLALSEDGYLINGGGQFLLGLPLDEDGNRSGYEPKVVRLDAKGIETLGTSRIAYRGNLPAYPLTANADFDETGSELLDRTLFARDPSTQGSGIVLGDERLKFLDRSLAGGSVRMISPEGRRVDLVLRWAKMTSLRSAGRECWNLFYRVRRDARSGEVAWKNCGHGFVFSADGRLDEASLVVPVMDIVIDTVRLGNVSIIFGTGGITQFADRTGLVKILRSEADGCAGGEFTGISMSSRGRLFAHYSNSEMRPLADIQFSGEESWFQTGDEDWQQSGKKRVA